MLKLGIGTVGLASTGCLFHGLYVTQDPAALLSRRRHIPNRHVLKDSFLAKLREPVQQLMNTQTRHNILVVTSNKHERASLLFEALETPMLHLHDAEHQPLDPLSVRLRRALVTELVASCNQVDVSQDWSRACDATKYILCQLVGGASSQQADSREDVGDGPVDSQRDPVGDEFVVREPEPSVERAFLEIVDVSRELLSVPGRLLASQLLQVGALNEHLFPDLRSCLNCIADSLSAPQAAGRSVVFDAIIPNRFELARPNVGVALEHGTASQGLSSTTSDVTQGTNTLESIITPLPIDTHHPTNQQRPPGASDPAPLPGNSEFPELYAWLLETAADNPDTRFVLHTQNPFGMELAGSHLANERDRGFDRNLAESFIWVNLPQCESLEDGTARLNHLLAERFVGARFPDRTVHLPEVFFSDQVVSFVKKHVGFSERSLRKFVNRFADNLVKDEAFDRDTLCITSDFKEFFNVLQNSVEAHVQEQEQSLRNMLQCNGLFRDTRQVLQDPSLGGWQANLLWLWEILLLVTGHSTFVTRLSDAAVKDLQLEMRNIPVVISPVLHLKTPTDADDVEDDTAFTETQNVATLEALMYWISQDVLWVDSSRVEGTVDLEQAAGDAVEMDSETPGAESRDGVAIRVVSLIDEEKRPFDIARQVVRAEPDTQRAFENMMHDQQIGNALHWIQRHFYYVQDKHQLERDKILIRRKRFAFQQSVKQHRENMKKYEQVVTKEQVVDAELELMRLDGVICMQEAEVERRDVNIASQKRLFDQELELQRRHEEQLSVLHRHDS